MTDGVTLAAAVEELQRRRALRNDLPQWCRLNGFEPARHHMLLLEQLKRVSDGEIDRLLIAMPPGSAKSTYASVLFPPWHLMRFPKHQLIAASHTVELSQKWGRRVRGIINEYQTILGYSLADQSQAAGRWETSEGGEYFAAGVGGGIAGWRGDLIVIDDPIRSRDDAESPLIRDNHWDWYRGDVIPRLKPGGRVVLIQTRWHEDDLAGRILEEAKVGSDNWTVFSLPAIAEANDPMGRKEGEPLWPEWEDQDNLDRKRRIIGPRDWIALYQQRPAPEEGSYFRKEWLKPVSFLPPKEVLKCYGGSDYAVTDQGGDYTVHVVVGLDPGGKLYLLDVWRERASSDRWVEAFCDLVTRYKPVGWAEEKGHITAGIGPYLDRRQRERKAYVAREGFPSRGDKEVRCQSIRGRMAQEGLYVLENMPWYPAFRSELMSFPAGKHDDQCDALGLVGQLLDIMVTGTPRAPPQLRVIDSGYAPFRGRRQIGDWRSY